MVWTTRRQTGKFWHVLNGGAFATVLACLVLLVPLDAAQLARDPGCASWVDCRQKALAAADRGEFEAFHDLAWRAVQLGPRNDPALMALVARAQALSGRPHDALVMIDRLADMGVALDADTSDDYVRTRQLPGWPEVLAHVARVRHPDAPAAATPPRPAPIATTGGRPAPATTAATGTTAAISAPRPARVEAVRFSAAAFTPAGFAYDAVSARFLFGDRLRRKLFIVSEPANRVSDFVRAEPAGLQDIAALEIDARRGDLWVASTEPAERTGTLHKLQLLSGRALRSFPIAADFAPVVIADLAVTAGGAVLMLDSAAGQLLMLRAGAPALERVLRIDSPAAASITVTADERVAYVAHRDGVARIDLRTRTVTPVAAAGDAPLDRLERIRWRDHALIGVRVQDDGSRRIIRFDLNDSGRAVAHATIIEPSVAASGPVFVTFEGDELVYVANGLARPPGGAPIDAPPAADVVAYRVRLR